MSAERFDEIRERVALRHHNSEDHSPIDVHKTADGDLIDSADGVVFPCAAADVEWLVGEVELLRRQVDIMAKALQLDADDLKRALAKESASGGAA
jgi:hypothetical protein